MNPEQPSREQIEARLTALLLGELPAAEAELLRWSIARDPELQKLHDQLKVTIGFVREAMKNPADAPVEREAPLKLSPERRQTLLAHFKTGRPQKSFWLRRIEIPSPNSLAIAAIVVLVICGLAAISIPNFVKSRATSHFSAVINNLRQIDAAKQEWALERGKRADAVPTANDLTPYVEGQALRSVAGEKYDLGKVSEPTVAEINGKQLTASSGSLDTAMASIKRTPMKGLSASPGPTATPNPQVSTPPPLARIALPNTESSQTESEQSTGLEIYSQSAVGYVNIDLSDSKTLPVIPMAPPSAGSVGQQLQSQPNTAPLVPMTLHFQGSAPLPQAEGQTPPIAAGGTFTVSTQGSAPAPGGEMAISGSVTPQVGEHFAELGPNPATKSAPTVTGSTFSTLSYSSPSGAPVANAQEQSVEGLSDSMGQKAAKDRNNFYGGFGGFGGGGFGGSGPGAIPSNAYADNTFGLSGQGGSPSRSGGTVSFGSAGSQANNPFASRLQSVEPSGNDLQNSLILATNGTPWDSRYFNFPDGSSSNVVAMDRNVGIFYRSLNKSADEGGEQPMLPRETQNANVAQNSFQMQATPSVGEAPMMGDETTISGRQTQMRSTVIQPEVTGFNFTAAPAATQPLVGEKNGIVTPSPTSGPGPQQYEMRTSKVDPNTFYAGLQNVSSFLSGSNIDLNTTYAASGSSGGLLYVTTPNPTRDVSGLAKQYFSSLGIKLDPPANLFYNDRLGVLFVYATPEDEDRIARAMQALNQVPRQKNLADNEMIPAGLINFEGVDVNQVLEVYAQMTGRTLLHGSLPMASIVWKNETPLTKAEAIQTLQRELALHGIAVVNVGDKFVKAVPVSEAGATGEQTDKPLPTPPASVPIPQPEVQTRDNAFSTFSLNVSDVSFKLAAASLENGRMPAPDSIRSEEFINAFDYHDPEPLQGQPLSFTFERARDPFAQERDFLRFSVKAAAMGRQEGRALNLVLLLDTSGSMERADRVAIIREALRVLSAQLQPRDTVSVVTFARTARLWADGVPGAQAGATLDKVGSITPEGGTNLEEAMRLAYETALRHFIAGGMNRVVLLTDGAANLGNVDPQALTQKVETERRQGIALDCFGVGWDDYNDDLLEQLSSNGDGRYAFINSPDEASTEFAAKLAGALQVAAEDVKVQVEFNPARVAAWRQIGYAKHQLTKEQFRDNSVAAGAIASREAGNGLYVIETRPDGEGPIATVRVRYRTPGTQDNYERSWLVDYSGAAPALEQSSPAMRLAATAAEFSEWLAHSPFAQDVTPDELLNDLSGVPQFYGTDKRPQQLEWMIRQAKSVSGK